MNENIPLQIYKQDTKYIVGCLRNTYDTLPHLSDPRSQDCHCIRHSD